MAGNSQETLETISGYLAGGCGEYELQSTPGLWLQMSQNVLNLHDIFVKVLVALLEEWESPAARQLIDAADPFVVWLQDVRQKNYETYEVLDNIYRSLMAATMSTPGLTWIRQHHAMRAQLVTGPLGLNANQIAQLDEEYQERTARSLTAWTAYQSALSQLYELTPWEPPPMTAYVGLQPSLPSSH